MISFVKSSSNIADFPKDKKEIVFVGRSNSGKSTLINSLFNRKMAFTGKTPGKTKMINFFIVDDLYYVVDVPGYGYAKRSKQEAILFGKMMEDFFCSSNIALVIMIVDSRIGLTKDDLDMKIYLERNNLNYLIAANKIDKLSNNQLNNHKKLLFADYSNVVYISAEKKIGIDLIQNKIIDYLNLPI